jgi:tRNA A37 methylthiotransferase MiaB
MDTDTSLQSLVWRIARLPGTFRIRVGMMHPLSVIQRPDVLDVFEHEKVYQFLHLPLQSGSSSMLHRMRRGYTGRDVLDIAAAARERYPSISISTDIIVAFPGETEHDFEATCLALQRLQPDVVNVTRFSARPGTPAAEMDHPDTAMAKDRSRRVSTLAQEIIWERMEQRVGSSTMALLLEERNGVTVAKTNEYQSVYLSDGEIGTLQRVHITGIEGNHLVGEIDGKEHI